MAEVNIQGPDGEFYAYKASPPGGTGPGLVLIQEIFGVNQNMRQIADGLAAKGFVVYVPDLFWRFEPRIELNADVEAEFNVALSYYQQYSEDQGIADLQASVAALRNDQDCNGKVGTQGYCLGGKLAYLMATRSDADANVGYYGVGIEAALGEAGNIGKPLMLHIAEEDGFVPKDAQAQVHTGLDRIGSVTIHDYAGEDHGFARETGHAYSAAAAELANQRSADFLTANLA
jgi:carboxymethylenebutenolidase